MPLGNGDSGVANQGCGGHNTSVGIADVMIINKDCNNDNANVSPSTVNRVQDGNVVNATQKGTKAEELQCRGDNQITTRDSNEAFVHNEEHTDN